MYTGDHSEIYTNEEARADFKQWTNNGKNNDWKQGNDGDDTCYAGVSETTSTNKKKRQHNQQQQQQQQQREGGHTISPMFKGLTSIRGLCGGKKSSRELNEMLYQK